MTDLPKLAAPARRALAAARVTRLEDLAQRSAEELAELHCMGPNAIGVLAAALKAAGLSYRKPNAR